MTVDNVERQRANDPRVKRMVAFWEHLEPEDLAHLGKVYAEQATFKDPFNDVQGLTRIRAVFADMFERMHDPRFVITDAALQGDRVFLVWDFSGRLRSSNQQLLYIHGASHLKFNDDGLVIYHRDYWDAAEEVYEKVPVLGALMRWLKRRIAA